MGQKVQKRKKESKEEELCGTWTWDGHGMDKAGRAIGQSWPRIPMGQNLSQSTSSLLPFPLPESNKPFFFLPFYHVRVLFFLALLSFFFLTSI